VRAVVALVVLAAFGCGRLGFDATGSGGDGGIGDAFVAPSCTQEPTWTRIVWATTGGTGNNAVALGDIDVDGHLDVVATNATAGSIDLLVGAGDGTEREIRQLPAGFDVQAIAVADVDRNGYLDVFTTHRGSSELIGWLGRAVFTYEAAGVFGVGAYPDSIEIGDVDNDGDLDIGTGNWGGRSMTWWHGDGAGNLANRLDLDTVHQAVRVRLVDFSGDGVPELLTTLSDNVSGFNGVGIHNGRGAEMYEAAMLFGSGFAAKGLAIANYNRDGFLDIAMTAAGTGQVNVLLGTGSATSLQATTPSSVGGAPQDLVATDLDNDGDVDIAVANTGGELNVLLNKGDGTFLPSKTLGAMPDYATRVVVGDLDGNGRPDLVAGGPQVVAFLTTCP